ncbi:MAG: BMP family ABC transporter substrate-binding protein [Deltaproteobacteria bacterium]|nr:BMP family ABC transporter substrate-binding protein [Deltaproteobacteria bacterium]
MNNALKNLLIVPVLCLIFALSACSAQDATGLNIVIVTSHSGVDDGSFNQDNYNGILAFIESRGNIDTVTTVREPTGDITAAIQAVADVAADYDVIVTPGYPFAAIGDIAAANPDKYFILIDCFPTDADGNTVELDNVYAMTFAEQESGFFAGIAAAMETHTGKIAVVNGIAYPTNVNFQWGFESGVNYANAHFGAGAQILEIAAYAGTDVTGKNVGGNYIGSFADIVAGKAVGEALIAEGCDIIFVAAGDSGNGVFAAVKDAGIYVIGVDVDQYDDGVSGDSNIILTSALKNMAVNVERQLNKIADGTFSGGNYLLKADTDSTGYVSAEGRQQLSDKTLATLSEVYERVKNGAIIPSANFNGYTPENFPGLYAVLRKEEIK